MGKRHLKGANAGTAARNICVAGASLAVLAAIAGLAIGCNEDEARDAFRTASSSAFEAGLNSFFDGLASGAFAVYDLGATDPNAP